MTDPPPVQQRGGAVIIQGEALPLLYRAVLALLARHRRDGVASPALLHHIRAVLFRAETSRPRHRLADPTPAESCCTRQDGDDLISVAAAAEILKWSRRRVQRLAVHDAGLLGARRIGSIWALKRSAVLVLANERKAPE